MASTIFWLLYIFSWSTCIPWRKLSLNHELIMGNNLLLSICELEEEVFCGRIPPFQKTSSYKFFSTMLDSFIFFSRKYGVPLSGFLSEIKQQLRKDLNNERRILREFRDGIIQYIFIGIVSIGFWFWSRYFLDLGIEFNPKFIIAVILQFTGISVFFLAFNILKQKILLPLRPVFCSYYTFWGLSWVGLPVVEVFGKSQILELNPIDPALKRIQNRMEKLVTSWKEKGFPVKCEVEGIISDLWEHYEYKFDEFKRNVKIMNFLVLALFYLGAFFILQMDFIEFFLIELK